VDKLRVKRAGQGLEREIVMIAVSVEQAQEKLVEIIDTLKPGEEVEIRRGDQAVAKLVGQKRQRQFGLGKGRLKIVREDVRKRSAESIG